MQDELGSQRYYCAYVIQDYIVGGNTTSSVFPFMADDYKSHCGLSSWLERERERVKENPEGKPTMNNGKQLLNNRSNVDKGFWWK
jgi:hypothetical protein